MFTGAMIAKRTFQQPKLTGLRPLADNGVTNSDQDLNFWFEEVPDSLLGKLVRGVSLPCPLVTIRDSWAHW